jgi:hypothetical protein
MKIEVIVKAYNEYTDNLGGRNRIKKHGVVRLQAEDNSRSVARLLLDVVTLSALLGSDICSDDVAVEFAEMCQTTPEVYERAAEKAANAACVTLMRGADGRMTQMQQMIDRIAMKVEG